MYLLDTCVLSELTKPTPHQRVVAWLSKHEEQFYFLSVLTLGEIEKGITKLPESKEKKRIKSWFENEMLRRFSDRILEVDERVARVWGRIQGETEKKGHPILTIDALLAATAQAHSLKLVTRNNADMKRTGAAIVDPWDEE